MLSFKKKDWMIILFFQKLPTVHRVWFCVCNGTSWSFDNSTWGFEHIWPWGIVDMISCPKAISWGLIQICAWLTMQSVIFISTQQASQLASYIHTFQQVKSFQASIVLTAGQETKFLWGYSDIWRELHSTPCVARQTESRGANCGLF